MIKCSVTMVNNRVRHIAEDLQPIESINRETFWRVAHRACAWSKREAISRCKSLRH